MPDFPEAMWKNARQADQRFDDTEILYRRVSPESWEDGGADITVDAIELPDMSVMRSKFSHPEWARFNGEDYAFADWGVVGFAVEDIPPGFLDNGVFNYTFKPHHAPLRKNYPHAEVRAYENGMHISATERLSPTAHLRWRMRLLRRIKKFVAPHEEVEVRQAPPDAAT